MHFRDGSVEERRPDHTNVEVAGPHDFGELKLDGDKNKDAVAVKRGKDK